MKPQITDHSTTSGLPAAMNKRRFNINLNYVMRYVTSVDDLTLRRDA